MSEMVTMVWAVLSSVIPSTGLSAGCECITYDNTYGKEYGVFTSPNWPVPYEDNTDCILYTFIAGEDEIVEITFDEFDLQKTNLDCIYGDYVKLFLHLKESSVNEHTPWNLVMCGKLGDIDQTHYSSSYSLVFEFHSDWRQGNNTGFRGTYRFLSQKMFETQGNLKPGTLCDYQFFSGSTNHSRGKFYSPQYPSTYPKDIKCTYRFLARYNERVKVMFEHIRLQRGDLSCLNSPDVIMVYDGEDNNCLVIGELCNTNTFVEYVSTGSDLFIEFLSRSHFPGQGFKGVYTFEDENTVVAYVDVPSIESVRRTLEYHTTTVLPATPSCDQRITSDATKNGTFTSPNYPEPYPMHIHCTYHFMGRGKERVQILFTDFDLHLPHEPSKDCDSVDAVMVFITINGQKERVDNFCGKDLPAQLMSNGASMIVEFRSIHSSPHVKGFRAIYRFVTNFGITGFQQDSQSVCGFIFNSTERSNGTFTTPNWPGYYPRDTECHYFFHGRPKEKVHITFAYFDVDGIPPCTTDSASDYVEFSNFRTVDRKLARHCGHKKPKVIDSDGDFFRVTFKSNDKFDGTGFEAFYQFRTHLDPFTVKRVSTSNGNHKCITIIDNISTIFLLLFIESVILYL